ncbi:MAG TPA: MFS transporter [Acidimicrobiia bacterium]|nr:MFS transporter [Acidimicrobiia bacterium]
MLRRTKIGYAIGDLGLSIAYFAVGFFFLFYLTDVVGLSAAAAGTVVLIGKLWDGVNDPIIGVMSDRTRSRHGRKRVYMLYGAIPFAVSFGLLWWIPLGASATVQFVLACAAILFFATAYSIVAVPYMAMVPIMTVDYDERTQVIGFRAMFSSFGTITGGGIALLVSKEDGVESALRGMSVGFGVFCALAVFVAAASIKGLEARHDADISRVPLRRYAELAREPNVSTLLWFKLLGAVATGVLTASLPFFAEHVIGNTGIASIGLAVYTITAAALVPLTNRLTHRFDKRYLLLTANIFAAALLAILGLVVDTDSAALFLIGSALLGASMSAYLLIPGSLVPDLVDFYEYERGERHESVFFGLWLTIHQLGFGIAGLLLGVFLQVFGYNGSNDVQTESGILGVRLAFGVVPGLFLVIAALVLLRYQITRDRFEEALKALGSVTPRPTEDGEPEP